MNVAWAELLLASLRDAGCGDLVVSPGSRSTPLVLAAARLGLACEVVIDERVAGFVALGRARATGRPTALVCTSGTAGAHYLPAVIEAAHARVPLVVLTADRPPELRGCAAPQTIDQQHLFGRFARGFVDLGLPDAHPAALRGLRRRAAQMVALSLSPEPGPVHINVPARLPLERGASDDALEAAARAITVEPVPRAAAVRACATDEAMDELAALCRGAERGLIVAGPMPLGADRAAVAALQRATGYPLAAEAGSQLRFGGDAPVVDAFDLLLRAKAFCAAHRPELVLELGAPATSGAWARAGDWLRGARRVVIAPHGWNDPSSSAHLVVQADVGDTAARLAARLTPRAGTWAEAWAAANRRARAWIDHAIAPGDEHAAVRAAVGALPDGALLMLGNSLPVRAVDTACAASSRRLDVIPQRGACGIDGLVAGAAGAAGAARRPTALLLGDVSFAHDVGGLAAARAASTPLAIVVIDNGGGRIFEQLPVASTPGAAELLERFFLTPPGLDVAAAAAAYGVATCATTDVAADVAAALARPGATVVHVRVAPHSARDLERAAAAAIDEVLA